MLARGSCRKVHGASAEIALGDNEVSGLGMASEDDEEIGFNFVSKCPSRTTQALKSKALNAL